MGDLPQHSRSCSWHGQHPQLAGRTARAGLSPLLGFAFPSLSPVNPRQPLGQASLGAHGSGAKEEISNWVWSGWKTGRKESSGQPLINLTAAGARAGLAKESPGPCCAHPRGVGVPQHHPCPWGGQSPPGHPDIQALESCSFPFCSHSPIFLFYLHCHLLALISSLAWGKLPKLDYRKVRARTPLLALGVLQVELERRRWGKSPSSAGMLFTSSWVPVSLQEKRPQDVPNSSSSCSLVCCQQPFKPGLFQPRETRFSFSLITPNNLPPSLPLFYFSLFFFFFFNLQHFYICCCSSRVLLSAPGEQVQPNLLCSTNNSLPCSPELLEAGTVTPRGNSPWCCAWEFLRGFLRSRSSQQGL